MDNRLVKRLQYAAITILLAYAALVGSDIQVSPAIIIASFAIATGALAYLQWQFALASRTGWARAWKGR